MQGFKSLLNKILVGYIIMILIMVTVGIWAIYNFSHLNKMFTDITNDNYDSVVAAESMTAAVERQDSAELCLLLGDMKGMQVFEEAGREFNKWMELEENNITLPYEGETVRRIKQDYLLYNEMHEKLITYVKNGEFEIAKALYFAEVEPLFYRMRQELQKLLEMNHEGVLEGNKQSVSSAKRATISTALGALAATIAGILFGLKISLNIVRPTVKLTETVRRIKNGYLNEYVDINTNDEIGELAREFNSMLSRLRAYEEAMNEKVLLMQQRALAIIKTIDDAIVLTDQNGKIVMLNPAAENLLNRPDADRESSELSAVFKEPVRPNRTIVESINGKTCYFDVEVMPLTAQGVITVFKDVTHIKNLEKLKSDFLRDVSHEIRTPLTTIMMGVGLLESSRQITQSARDREIIMMVKEETVRLTNLVDELLELSRLEAGKATLKLQSIDWEMFLQKVIAPYKLQGEVRNVTVRLETMGIFPDIKVDADKLQSVIANLLTNAFRYTPQGGSIFLRAVGEEHFIRVEVEDTGKGISAETKEKIFDMFYQADHKNAGKMGLGLAISRAIIEAHGGSITVESNKGQGAKFSFLLPEDKGVK